LLAECNRRGVDAVLGADAGFLARAMAFGIRSVCGLHCGLTMKRQGAKKSGNRLACALWHTSGTAPVCELHCGLQTGDPLMATNEVVRARIDAGIKHEAAAVLAAMGLSVSDAVRLLLTRIAHEKALPFEPLVPNEATIAAMKEARKGKLTSFASVDALMRDLHAKD
jgi:DNA-damage-inducible protein J